jgi:hypothetical protein
MLSPVHTLPHQTPHNRRSHRTKKAPAVGLSKRQEELLHAIHQLRYVTALDMTRLFYTQTSINHVREILSLLSGKNDYAERHYLYRFPIPELATRKKSIRLAVKAARTCNRKA